MSGFLEGTDVFEMINRIKLLSVQDIFVTVMSNGIVQSKATKLNTTQLREGFMNAEGVQLSSIGGDYSPVTVQKGNKSGAGNVDLYDTEEFHESFKVENVTLTGFDIVSDSVKGDGTDLKIEWGEEIEGLTDESMIELAEFMLDFFFAEVLRKIAA